MNPTFLGSYARCSSRPRNSRTNSLGIIWHRKGRSSRLGWFWQWISCKNELQGWSLDSTTTCGTSESSFSSKSRNSHFSFHFHRRSGTLKPVIQRVYPSGHHRRRRGNQLIRVYLLFKAWTFWELLPRWSPNAALVVLISSAQLSAEAISGLESGVGESNFSWLILKVFFET